MIGSSVFITGANKGIGLGLIRELAKDRKLKYIFAGYYLKEQVKNLEDIQKENPNVKIVFHDATSDFTIKTAVSEVEKYLGEDGSLNLLINNAAILGISGVTPQNPNREEYLQHFNVNALGSVMTVSAFLPLLRKANAKGEPARIINISSTNGSTEMCNPFYNTADGVLKNFAYGMSKAALNHYTKALSMDEPELVTVSICPGWILTDMGGPNAPITVEECAKNLINKIGTLTKKDSGAFMNVESRIPY